jgi:hypothetical protein
MLIYNADMPRIAMEFLSVGRSKNALAGHLGIVKSTLFKWIEDHPEFAEAVEIGFMRGQAWLEEEGRKSLWDCKNFNNVVYLQTMKAQYRIKEDAEPLSQAIANAVADKTAELFDAAVKEHKV